MLLPVEEDKPEKYINEHTKKNYQSQDMIATPRSKRLCSKEDQSENIKMNH